MIITKTPFVKTAKEHKLQNFLSTRITNRFTWRTRSTRFFANWFRNSALFFSRNSHSLVFVIGHLFIFGDRVANLDLLWHFDGFGAFYFFLVLDRFRAWHINAFHNLFSTSNFNRLHHSLSTRNFDLFANDLFIRDFFSANNSFSTGNLALLGFVLERWHLNGSHFVSSAGHLYLLLNHFFAGYHFFDGFVSATRHFFVDVDGFGDFDSHLVRHLSGASSVFCTGIVFAVGRDLDGGV